MYLQLLDSSFSSGFHVASGQVSRQHLLPLQFCLLVPLAKLLVVLSKLSMVVKNRRA